MMINNDEHDEKHGNYKDHINRNKSTCKHREGEEMYARGERVNTQTNTNLNNDKE